MIIAFTGHRPDKLGGYGEVNPLRDAILQKILSSLRVLRPSHAISGMAVGVDQWAAACCIHLGIPWTAAIPFVGQERMWPQQSRDEYFRLLRKATKQVVVTPNGARTGNPPDPLKAMQTRNEWMVDNCDLLIAVWNKSKGGTANCVRYARLMRKQIVYINPRDLI